MTIPSEQRLIVTFTVDADREAGLNGWYNLEHVAPRLGLPVGTGFVGCTRYVVTNGASRFLNVYDLDKGALGTDAYGQLRDHEAGMDDVAYYAGHFKDEHPDTFRRLVVSLEDVLTEKDGGAADAVVLEVVRGTSYDDLAPWGRTGLRARLHADPVVTRASVWNLDDAAGFVLTTELALRHHLDWRPYYAGPLSWLPGGTFGDTAPEVLLGHEVARFERQEQA
jgi:hypothetical protein